MSIRSNALLQLLHGSDETRAEAGAQLCLGARLIWTLGWDLVDLSMDGVCNDLNGGIHALNLLAKFFHGVAV